MKSPLHSLTLFVVLAMTMAATRAEAADPLPKGTVIVIPAAGEAVYLPEWAQGHEPKSTKVLQGEAVLLTHEEAKKMLLAMRDLEACRTGLQACEKKLIATVPPGGGYWTTNKGHAVMIGGFAISVSAAFVLGVVLVK